jgi:conjugative transfer signal peptidase TraF
MLRNRIFGGAVIAAVSGALVYSAAIQGHQMTWNLSPSVPRGLYAMDSGACQRGDLVSFRPPPQAAALIYSRGYLPNGAGLIKEIVGLPGDLVCVRPDGFVVNRVRFGDLAQLDSRGRSLTPYPFCGAVPAGQAFVATRAPLSYDSRYFGPIPIASLTRVVPLWTY